MQVEFTVTASSPSAAERAAAVYLSQLCDLLAAAVRSPLRFYLPKEDSRDERILANSRSTSLDRILTKQEWDWITGRLVYLRREHPRFLAAASWYRKGLVGSDVLNDFCCYWRVIERLALSYADKSGLNDNTKGQSKACVLQIASELFTGDGAPEALADGEGIGRIIKLRNDLSHGNIAITGEVIEQASGWLAPLEEAAFGVLNAIRRAKISDDLLA